MKVRLRPRPGKLRPLPKAWPSICQKIREREGSRCRYCGWYEEGGNVDHLIPRRLGGTDALNNLAWLCTIHHASKTRAEAYLFERADPFPWTTFLEVVRKTGPVPDEKAIQVALGRVRRLLETPASGRKR